MENYVKRLGIANIVFGAAGGLAALILLLAGDGIFGVYSMFDAPMLGIVVSVVALMHLVTAVPCIVGGLYLLRFRNWARVLLIVTSALNTLTVPFGSILGAFGLWVLLLPEIEPLFSDTPASLMYHKRTPRKPGNPAHASRATLPIERYNPGQIE